MGQTYRNVGLPSYVRFPPRKRRELRTSGMSQGANKRNVAVAGLLDQPPRPGSGKQPRQDIGYVLAGSLRNSRTLLRSWGSRLCALVADPDFNVKKTPPCTTSHEAHAARWLPALLTFDAFCFYSPIVVALALSSVPPRLGYWRPCKGTAYATVTCSCFPFWMHPLKTIPLANVRPTRRALLLHGFFFPSYSSFYLIFILHHERLRCPAQDT